MFKLIFHNKQFKKLLWSYIVIVFIPIAIIGILTSNIIFKIVRDDVVKLNRRILEQHKNSIDMNLGVINSLTYQVGKNAGIMNYLYTKYNEPAAKAYHAKKLATELSLYQIGDDLLENVGIYSFVNDVIISSTNMYTSYEYYDKFLRNGELTYRQWHEMILNLKDPLCIPLSDKEGVRDYNLFTYYQPISPVDQNLGVFITNVQEKNLFAEFDAIELTERLNFIIIDKNGKRLMSLYDFDENFDVSILNSPDEIFTYTQNGKNLIGISSISSISNLIYLYILSENALLGNVGEISALFNLLLVISLLICFVVAYVNTNSNYKPIKNILDENEKLNISLNEKTMILTQNIIVNLLNGSNKLDNKGLLENGIVFNKRNFSVISIAVSAYDAERPNLILGKEFLSILIIDKIKLSLEQNGITVYFTSLDNEKYALIVNYDDVDVLGVLEKFSEIMEEKYNIGINIGIGKSGIGISDINGAYETSRIALNHNLRRGFVGIAVFDKVKSMIDDKINFSHAKRDILLKAILAGSVEKVKDLLNEIYQSNFESRHLSETILKALVNRLFVTVLEALDELHIQDDDRRTEYTVICNTCIANPDPYDGFDTFKTLCVDLCEHVSEQNSYQNVTKEKIFSFIEKNYKNSNISLRDLSDRLRMNYTYLSKFIKEQAGSPFIDLLNKFRLEKAIVLLKTTDKTIEQIAKSVGYESLNTFGKTFKKYYSVSPSEYRKLAR